MWELEQWILEDGVQAPSTYEVGTVLGLWSVTQEIADEHLERSCEDEVPMLDVVDAQEAIETP